MTSFSRSPSQRRQRGLTAKAIVLGHPATEILHHGRTAHLLPVRSGDHRSRYSPGMRLSVKQMVPGPTACHVILTSVQGPKTAFTLGQLTVQDARALGHTRLDHLWRHWITNHDQAWLGRHIEAGTDTDTEIARRFTTRWAGKLAWLLRFSLDIAAEPRLLAARSDELYVTADAMALRGELPALTETEWARHISPDSRYRAAERATTLLADRAARGRDERLRDAKAKARTKGYDITREIRLHDAHVRNGKADKALRQLELIESRVFPAAA